MSSSTANHGPLSGLRVVDASTILAGPLACQILGDFGAEVIKVEHPKAGDGMRGHGPSVDGTPIWWSEISRNKRTVALSLSSPEGAEVLRRLVATADVLVENFRPGTLERWGLSPEHLLELNPRLVVARITGFGQTGPYAARAGFGTLAEAMSGFAHLTGQADGPPTLPAFGLADSIAGIAASSAISMALYERERSGTGQVIDLSLLEPIMAAVGPGPSVYGLTGQVGQRHGNRSTNNSPRNAYETEDGHWVAISTSAQAIAERVLTLVGHPEVIDEPWFASGHTRAQHADQLDGYVGDWIGERTRAEVVAAFTEAGAAVAPVYSAQDLVEDEHVRATQMLTPVDDPALGEVLQHNVMWRMSETPGGIRFPGRAIGADTDAVLTELGLSPDDISKLREEEVIR
ncbi:CoA transferase [Nocardioides sp. MAH-18]|uniref:CoA transferase n=1 Tax=Nocardioides agri TaxID=2682843 RepID=A0A6L6XNY8_9ACTN|nr:MULTISPECIES: CoA transferase [unclassified Nocardioides]MBA2953566.1 CoA transferase [Nocardioides sp. CGMCC 1.13656]MVQ48433.1 CoA transferase [Nocardioides sp. MAH-18]